MYPFICRWMFFQEQECLDVISVYKRVFQE